MPTLTWPVCVHVYGSGRVRVYVLGAQVCPSSTDLHNHSIVAVEPKMKAKEFAAKVHSEVWTKHAFHFLKVLHLDGTIGTDAAAVCVSSHRFPD